MMEQLREKLSALEKETLELAFHTKAQTKILTHLSREQKETHRLIGSNQKRIVKLETDVGWIKRVGVFLIASLGVSHWFKV